MTDRAPLPEWNRWLPQAVMIGVSLALVLLLAAGPLLTVAVQKRLLPPPVFTVRLGRYALVAPCPPSTFCDESTPFFGVWWGYPFKDGSTSYRSVLFFYRPPAKRR